MFIINAPILKYFSNPTQRRRDANIINLLPPLVSVTLLELPMFEAASTPRTVSRVLMLPDVVPRLD